MTPIQAAILRAMPTGILMTTGDIWDRVATMRLPALAAELSGMAGAGWVRRSPVTLWTRTPAGAEALVEFERVGVKCPA